MAENNALWNWGNQQTYHEKIKQEIEKASTGGITIDDTLSDISENPVQNKVITDELKKKLEAGDLPTSLPANGGNADTVKTQKKASLGTSYTAYYPTFVDSDNASATAETLYTHYDIKFFGMDGTADTEGYVGIQLGNTTAKGNAGNSKGQITFYNNENAYYAILRSSRYQSANATIYLPDAGGTLALNTHAYGTCATAADTAEKVVTVTGTTGWTLTVGSEVIVKFTNTNTASNCTLNVNNTGAKQIWYNNAVYTAASSTVNGYANRYIKYMYDGTYWVWMGYSLDANTWTAASATANGYVSTGTQTFAGAKTFNGVVKVAGATDANISQVRNIAAGTAAATTTNCPNGALYGQYS